MSEVREQELSHLLVQAGVGWLVRDPRNATGLLQHLDQAAEEYNRRFRTRADLLAACKAMPEKMRAFLQNLGAGVTPPILAMVARIVLRDAEVLAVRFEFASRQDSLSLHVEIHDPECGAQNFDSTDIWDAQVLRHFGLLMVGHKPAIAGYYAANMP